MSNNKEDISILFYCAKTLNPLIVDLSKAAKKILGRNDIEDIHDLRVASRRIRSVLDSFSDHLPKKESKDWVKDIRAITKSYGKVRDIDVQLNLINKIYSETDDRKLRSGLRRIKLRLEQKRKSRQGKTEKRTKVLLESSAIVNLSEWVKTILQHTEEAWAPSPALFQLGYKQIQSRLDEFLFYEVFIFDRQRVEELHQMRIAAKKLRYSLEVFSELYEQETDFALKISKQAQDYLGEIHDCDVWIEFLPAFMEKEFQRIKDFYGYAQPYYRIRPGIEYFIDDRKREREKLYKNFLRDWKNWKLKETWLNLRKVIFLTSLEIQSQPSQPEQPSPTPEGTNDTQQENISEDSASPTS